MKRISAIVLIWIMVVAAASGCAKNQGSSPGSAAGTGLYSTEQEVRPSPEWVTKLDAAKDAEHPLVSLFSS